MAKFLFILFSVWFSSATLALDSFDYKKISKELNAIAKEMEQIDTALLTEQSVEQKTLLIYREQLQTQRNTIEQITGNITPLLKNSQSELADLGPPPVATEEKEAEEEPENIKKQRALLNTKKLEIEGLLIQAEALLSKSGRLLEKITSLRREQFISQFFDTQGSAFDLSLWSTALVEYYQQLTKLPTFFDNKIKQNIKLVFSAILFFIFLIVAGVYSRKRAKQLLIAKAHPRLTVVALSLIAPMLTLFAGLILIYLALSTQGQITDVNQDFIYHAFLLSAVFFFTFFATNNLHIADFIRSNTRWLIQLVVLIFVADALILDINRLTGASVVSAVAQSYVSTTFFAVILAVFSLKVIYRRATNKHVLFPLPIFWLLAGLSVIVIAANVFAYVALSRFIFERTVMLSLLLLAVVLIRAAAIPIFNRLESFIQGDEQNNPDDKPEKLLTFWLSLSLDLLLFFISMPITALLFGIEWSFIKDWALQAFLGFKVGAVTISIAEIAIAIGLFLVLLFVTRLVQKVLSQKILPNTKMDNSVQQSIIQVIGYLGLIIALLVGISSVGFDLSNLALIAGALSVGIGFGLQSIVSNFVSGLILLFERPIKIGDWIITDSGEGIVKKINVRATEIETFDRTSIIIPNAELISSSVKNWTHKDKIGRVIIPVGVSYDSDPDQVNRILQDYIKENNKILRWPEPKVLFQDFADSALLFELRFFIRDISELMVVSTQVRFDIWHKFKEANIEISYPQRDLHIRSAPGLKGVFNDN